MVAIHFTEPNAEVQAAGAVVGVVGLPTSVVKGAQQCYSLVDPQSFEVVMKEGKSISLIVANNKFNIVQVYTLAAIALMPEIYVQASSSRLWRAIMAEINFRRAWEYAPFRIANVSPEEAIRNIMYPNKICFTHEDLVGGPVQKAIAEVTDMEKLLKEIANVITANKFKNQDFWRQYEDKFQEERLHLAQAFMQSLKDSGDLMLCEMSVEQIKGIGGNIIINTVSRGNVTYIWLPMKSLETISTDWVAVIVADEKTRKISPVGFRYSPHVIVFSKETNSVVYSCLQGRAQQALPGWRLSGRGLIRELEPNTPVSVVVKEVFPHLDFA